MKNVTFRIFTANENNTAHRLLIVSNRYNSSFSSTVSLGNLNFFAPISPTANSSINVIKNINYSGSSTVPVKMTDVEIAVN